MPIKVVKRLGKEGVAHPHHGRDEERVRQHQRDRQGDDQASAPSERLQRN
jgi:hypothetical protein